MNVVQHLWFEADMATAVALYTRLVPGSRIEGRSAVMADNPGGPAGAVQTLSFSLGGQAYRALQAPGLAGFNHAFSIVLECDTQAEIDRLWEALGDGGQFEQCGWLRDRWGLSWQIVPRRLGELLASDDPGVARRVTERMLQMVKLDIAALENAALESTGEGA
ncbi:MAG: VOC family protein [Caulobacteraceae bacterium]|nr:VOC family protein [Caulobacteraceae bacterium]